MCNLHIRKVSIFILIFLILSTMFSSNLVASEAIPLFNWEIDVTHQSKDLNSVIYEKGIFIAVGNSGAIITSSDGIKWTRQNSPTFVDLQFVAYNGKVFIAGGTYEYNSGIITSVDGINWTLTYSVMNRPYIKYAASNGSSFVVSGSGILLYSKDGYHWEENKTIVSGMAATDVTVNPLWDGSKYNVFLADLGLNSNRQMLSISDDSVWIETKPIKSGPLLLSDGLIDKLLYINGEYIFFIIKYNYATLGFEKSVFSTKDFDSWESKDTFYEFTNVEVENTNKQDIFCYKGSTLLKYNANGTFDEVLKASDEITINSAVSDGENIIAVGTGGAVYKIDKTGKVFSMYSGRLYTINAAVAVNDKIITVGEHGQIAYSTDGKNWSKQMPVTQENLNAVMWNGKLIIAAGDGGTIIISRDGIKWDNCISGTSVKLIKLFNINGKLFATGVNATILYSEDGVSWKKCYGIETPKNITSAEYEPISRLEYKNNTFIAIYDYNSEKYLESKDGLNWVYKLEKTNKPTVFHDRNEVIYKENGLRLKGSFSGAITYSPDGIRWSDANSPVIKFDPKSSDYIDQNKTGYFGDYFYGPVKAITKFKGKYYVFHKYGLILSAAVNGKLPSASPVSIDAFNNPSFNDDNPLIPDIQPVFEGNTILMEVEQIKKYCNSDVNIDSKKRKITISLNGNTAVYYLNSKISYLNGKKVLQKVKAVLKDKRYFIEAFSAFKALGLKLAYNKDKRLLSIDYDFTPTVKMNWNKLYETNYYEIENASNGKSRISLGYDSKRNRVIYLSDSKTWKPVLLSNDKNGISHICWCGSFYLAVGGDISKEESDNTNNNGNKDSLSNYSGKLYKSTDGRKWEEVKTDISFGYISGIATSDKNIILTDNKGYVYKGDKTLNFRSCLELKNENIFSTRFINGKFYLETKDKKYVSSDAVHWSSLKTYKYTTIGNNGELITHGEKDISISYDFGKSYKKLYNYNSNNLYLYSYCRGGGKTILVFAKRNTYKADDNRIYISVTSDGKRWQSATVGCPNIFLDIKAAWDGKQFIITGNGSEKSYAYSFK